MPLYKAQAVEYDDVREFPGPPKLRRTKEMNEYTSRRRSEA